MNIKIYKKINEFIKGKLRKIWNKKNIEFVR
jgi:hypothetical protein